LTNHDDFGPAE